MVLHTGILDNSRSEMNHNLFVALWFLLVGALTLWATYDFRRESYIVMSSAIPLGFVGFAATTVALWHLPLDALPMVGIGAYAASLVVGLALCGAVIGIYRMVKAAPAEAE